MTTSKTKDPLKGKYFHSKNTGGGICWQGMFLGRVSPDAYLVQLFSWVMGEPSDQLIVLTSAMGEWIIYDDEETWRERGDATLGATRSAQNTPARPLAATHAHEVDKDGPSTPMDVERLRGAK